MSQLHFFAIFLAGLQFSVDASKRTHDQKINGPLLLNELLLDYDSFSRPSEEDNGPSRIQISLRPSFVTWKEDQFRAAFTFEQTWMDGRLKFTGDKELKLSDENTRLWLPDTNFHNFLEYNHPTHGTISIQPQGQVHWLQQVILTIPCPLEPSEVWIHDGIVNCTLTLSSRGYSNDELEYAWSQQIPTPDLGGSNQLRKIDFLDENKIEDPILEFFNSSSNFSTVSTPVVKKLPKLSALFTVQTDFTKSVLRYLTKKAMKDL